MLVGQFRTMGITPTEIAQSRSAIGAKVELGTEKKHSARVWLSSQLEPAKLDMKFARAVFGTLRNCWTVLFVKSALDPTLSEEIKQVFLEIVPSTLGMTFLVFSQSAYWMPELPLILPAASLDIQMAVLQTAPLHFFGAFAGSAGLVHEGARHLFLGKGSSLSIEDIRFLSTATFTGLEPKTPSSQEGTQEPPAKMAKRV
mmetsp:Transcript_14943/g.32266  ORF Transcript_14943/g.32266 Transcript_14943/m.32266 type:complete len:200 (+) Transcript_14943:584-1183(+)